MIQIEAIHIEEFRGIRKLDLRFGGESFIIQGPNGSGKSGVVDAIEFALTGNIARLSGAGTGGLSVLRHGPHVHRRDDPGAAMVAMTVRNPATGQTAVLTRHVKTANEWELDPDTAEMRSAIERAQQHPELALSRREIIKFILVEAGRRAQEVQALLKLDRVADVRRLLRTAQTKTSHEESTSKSEVNAAEEALRRHLDLTSLLSTEIAAEINKRRALLGLDPFGTITPDTDLGASVESDSAKATFDKVSAIRDVQALINRLESNAELSAAVESLNTALDALADDVTILASLKQRAFVNTGLQLISDSHCPLCDTEWEDVTTLRAHLEEKLARSEQAALLQERIQDAARLVVNETRALRQLTATARSHAAAHSASKLEDRLQAWMDDLAAFEGELSTVERAAAQADRLATDPLATPAEAPAELATLLMTLKAKPDQSATAAAGSFLTIAQDRWGRVRNARADYEKAAAARATANTVYETYCAVADEALTTLYETVEDEFSDYYRAINADDEARFKADLEPSAGKLDLLVDFYGIGMFPPGAYHSEGHQDGMGVCLYLALVRQLLGADFTFAVLDDVITSVDRDHRRQFCKLLKERFAGVQFIVTTHDEIWAKQMQSSGLVRRSAQARFHGWSIDEGPAYDNSTDFWDRIDADLAQNDVPGAAHKLRRNLEWIMADLAEAMGAQVTFRADARYELGDMLAAVKGRHGALLKKGASSASSWNNDAAKQRVEELKSARSQALLAQDGENWAINALVHYNEWATMSRSDFVPVVEACKHFLSLFSCSNPACESWIHVIGRPGQEESLRCDCSAYDLNLRSK